MENKIYSINGPVVTIKGSQAGGGVGSAQASQGDGVIGSQGHTGGRCV